MEGTKMRQLVFRSADIYCQNLNNLNLHNIIIFILERKEGEKGKRPERQRERVCARDGVLLKMWLASVLKTAVGERINYFESSENQHIKITFFLGNYFNGRRRSERYIKITKIGIIFCRHLATFGMMTFHVRFPYSFTFEEEPAWVFGN